jgi:periplasmic copper chaperone A
MRKKYLLSFATVVFTSHLYATSASAHVTLDAREATIGAIFKGVFRVTDGCQGSPTVRMSIHIPDGATLARPMPKPNWQIEIVTGKFEKPYSVGSRAVAEGVKEVIFTGKLPDEYYDEFVVTTFISPDLEAGKSLYFSTLQECEKGSNDWSEIPAEGKSPADYRHLAPGVKLIPSH